MALDSEERKARIYELELEYQNGLHGVEMVDQDERSRRIKLRLLSLSDENALLKDKLNTKDSQYRQLTRQHGLVRGELKEAKATAQTQDARLKKQGIELSSLKAEVDSLGSSVQDSGKALQEKFALTRELDRLRPEMEHLRSQLANHQAVIAEKHGLQRQLDSLEVELENEKRSKQRAQDKESKSLSDELRSRTEEAEKRLASEKKEREKMKKEHEKAVSEVNGHNERLEERLSTLRTKLKEVQSEMKDTKAELGRCRAELEQARSVGSKAKKPSAPTNAPLAKKRRAEESSFEEITIQTPGNECQIEKPTKKRGGEHAPFGEKSAFSVTPFLNRNKGTTDESQELESPELPVATESDLAPDPHNEEPAGDTGDEVEDHQEAPSPAKPKTTAAPKAQKPRGRPKAKPLSETAASKKNIASQIGASGGKSKMNSATEDLPTVTGQENIASPPNVPKAHKLDAKPKAQKLGTAKPGLGPVSNAAIGDPEAKRKKRKLLGGANSTLFDEDDAEAAAVPTKPLQGQTTKRKRAPLGGLSNAFASSSFSPLKRDRRGVGASFLG